MLSEDPELPFLRIAWSKGALREYFNRIVLPALLPGQQATAVRRQHTRYAPGKKCDLLCSVSLDGEATPRLATMTFGTGDWLSSQAWDRDAGFLDEERACLIELFPADFAMPGLASATDPQRVAPFLAGLGNGWGDVDAPSLRITVRRYVPHRRCVVQYEMSTPDGERRLIGKVYAEEGRAAEVASKLAALSDQLGVAAPAPACAGLHEGWNLALMEWLPGVSMKRVLRDDPSLAVARAAVSRAVPALAALHSVRFEHGEVRSIRDEVRHARKRGARIGLVSPALGAQLESLLGRLDPLARDLASAEPSFIHDGFKPAQVLLDDDRVRIIDFDGSGLGDPAMDVGKFMAQLRKEALLAEREDFRSLPAYALEQYLRCADDENLAIRARIAECAALAQIAVQRFRSKPLAYGREGDASLPALLLREAHDCLARL